MFELTAKQIEDILKELENLINGEADISKSFCKREKTFKAFSYKFKVENFEHSEEELNIHIGDNGSISINTFRRAGCICDFGFKLSFMKKIFKILEREQ